MAPVRRYLRISKYSVLECRIHLDNPALVQSWLLNPRNPILPRVIESIRPLVLPKLREERERSKKKVAKKKLIKDVIVQGKTSSNDFDVSMFLTETSTRHSLLTKHKHFREKGPGKMQSNSTKLINDTNQDPVDIDDEDADNDMPIRLEDSDEEGVRLADIPTASKRPKRSHATEDPGASDVDETGSPIEVDSDAEPPPSKRRKTPGPLDVDDQDEDGGEDKKKLAMDVSFEGFAIYGRVLCLVVRKKDTRSQSAAGGRAVDAGGNGQMAAGQARMENWITSTQIPVGDEAP